MYLQNNGVDAVILPRSNARSLSRGSPYRGKVVREIKRIGIESWIIERQYWKDGKWRYSSQL
ncbi:MAG: hypothetical protein QXV17_13220 [Candidatus Micrarchaeaceae archaeon]